MEGMKMKKEISIIALLFFYSIFTDAQVRWWGIYDFEIRKGAEDSRPDFNYLPNDYVQLSVHQFQLCMESELNNQMTIAAMISNNYTKSFDLKGLEVQLAYVTYSNQIGRAHV
jgi:hypothetical protein